MLDARTWRCIAAPAPSGIDVEAQQSRLAPPIAALRCVVLSGSYTALAEVDSANAGVRLTQSPAAAQQMLPYFSTGRERRVRDVSRSLAAACADLMAQ